MRKTLLVCTFVAILLIQCIISLPLFFAVVGVAQLRRYLGGGLVLIRTFIPNFEKFTKREASLEARFRYVHSRVKEHAESIAFYAGDDLGTCVSKATNEIMDKSAWWNACLTARCLFFCFQRVVLWKGSLKI